MKRFFVVLRWTLTVLGAIALSTVAINATDNLGNLSNSLLGSVVNFNDGNNSCPDGMSFITSDTGGFCIDTYEASPGADCPNKNPNNQDETRMDLEAPSCKAVSVSGALPWRNISQPQAARACAASGKRLPSNKEWYQASLGTPDASGNVSRGDCNVNNDGGGVPNRTGSHPRCVSSFGAFDMIGNVWEWVDASAVEGSLNGIPLPDEGYVTSIDANGVPIHTDPETPDLNFNADYIWVDRTDVRGVLRGGYYGNGTDAGNYALNAITPPSFAGIGVGFRCAQ